MAGVFGNSPAKLTNVVVLLVFPMMAECVIHAVT